MLNNFEMSFLLSRYFYFSRKFCSKLTRAMDLDVFKNTISGTIPIYPQTLLSLYHHILILLYKFNATELLMPLWVHMI